MKYVVGEDEYSAQTPEDLVHEMNKSSFARTNDDQEFMDNVSQRLKLQSNHDVRTDSAENFVADLIKSGVMKEVP